VTVESRARPRSPDGGRSPAGAARLFRSLGPWPCPRRRPRLEPRRASTLHSAHTRQVHVSGGGTTAPHNASRTHALADRTTSGLFVTLTTNRNTHRTPTPSWETSALWAELRATVPMSATATVWYAGRRLDPYTHDTSPPTPIDRRPRTRRGRRWVHRPRPPTPPEPQLLRTR
jgi:hypothetical protein